MQWDNSEAELPRNQKTLSGHLKEEGWQEVERISEEDAIVMGNWGVDSRQDQDSLSSDTVVVLSRIGSRYCRDMWIC